MPSAHDETLHSVVEFPASARTCGASPSRPVFRTSHSNPNSSGTDFSSLLGRGRRRGSKPCRRSVTAPVLQIVRWQHASENRALIGMFTDLMNKIFGPSTRASAPIGFRAGGRRAFTRDARPASMAPARPQRKASFLVLLNGRGAPGGASARLWLPRRRQVQLAMAILQRISLTANGRWSCCWDST